MSPPWIVPIGLYADSSGTQVNTTRPGSTSAISNCISPPIGGWGGSPSTLARTESTPAMADPLAVLGPGECHVTVLVRCGPQSAWVSVSTSSVVMVSSRLAARVLGGSRGGLGHPGRQRGQDPTP